MPNVGNGMRGWATYERDGYEPYVKGIFDEEGRLMVIINWNTDLGDAWEWAENPYYPLKYSTFAYQMGVNFIIYAMSHLTGRSTCLQASSSFSSSTARSSSSRAISLWA